MAEPAVDFQSVTFRYPGAPAAALENVSLRVEMGERLGVLGPNGGGKSTLLKLMLGLLSPTSGTVRVCGMPPREARSAGVVGYVAQRADAELGMPLSVREVVTLGSAWRVPAWRGVPTAIRTRVDHMLGLTGADAFADKPIGKLSGGQLQRAMIARALAADARVLALDEPTVGIDASGQHMFAELLARVHAELGVTIMVVSHDLRAVVAGSDRVACLARRLHSHTSPQGLTPQILAELFSHDVAGLGGMLAGMHVHAHTPGECCEHEHARTQVASPLPHSQSSTPVQLGVSAVTRANTEGARRADP